MMKSTLRYILTIVCVFSVLSCEKAPATLYVMGSRKAENPLIKELVFTGDDIKFYNVTTFELTLSDLTIEKLIDSLDIYKQSVYGRLSFYYNDKPLFSMRVIGENTGSGMIEDLVLIVYGYSRKFYLADGYPLIRKYEWDDFNWSDREAWRKARDEREENAKRREVEWNIFIKYLSNAGKIVN